MKKLFKVNRIRIITDFIIVAIVVTVFSIGFSVGDSVPIYGDGKLSAIYRGNVNEKRVSLMFNVYENTDVVNGIIKTLEENDAKATFFVGGCWADDNETTLNNIVKSGNEIANHGYFHKDHKKIDKAQNIQEISLTEKIVYALCGKKTTLFAPPSGSYSVQTLSAAEELGYKVVMWSSDTIDWRDSDEEVIFTRAIKKLSNGELILMHPKAHTLKVLPRIIKYCKDNGFSLVTVSENLS
ncbi:MAG: polysaccharide deacetylase family protein [Clostridia bacterium]|nr:polysaccharide deacetylase family protein [Clostridia bacterium]